MKRSIPRGRGRCSPWWRRSARPGCARRSRYSPGFARDHATGVVHTFGRTWRASFRRATTLGALATGALVVLGVDARAAWGRPIGAVAIPVLVVLMVLVVATALLALVVLSERPTVRLRHARASTSPCGTGTSPWRR